MTAPACTTWSTRSSTTRSTRRWPATATRIDVIIHFDNSVTVEDNGRGIPVGMHPTENRPTRRVVMTVLHAGGKFDHGELQGLRRPARRRRVGRQRAVRVAEARDPARRQGLLPGVPARRSRPPSSSRSASPSGRGTKITFKPDPEIFKDVPSSASSMLAQRLRELSYLNRGLHDRRSATSAADKSHEFKFEGGIAQFVADLNTSKTVGARQADPRSSARWTARRSRSRCSGTTRYQESDLLLHQQHQEQGRRHAPDRLPRGADAHGQRLRARRRACSRTSRAASSARTSARG